MAKKTKAAAVVAPVAPVAPVTDATRHTETVARFNVSRICRETLEKNRDATTEDVVTAIKAVNPAADINASSIASTLSQQRSKLYGTGNKGGATAGAVTMEEMKTAKRLANENGGVENLISLIANLEEMAAEVGGLNRLKMALEGVLEVMG